MLWFVFLVKRVPKISTDAGITGYREATNSFLSYASEGMLKDLIPYLVGEDPERIEYHWQACFRRRFYRGGPATGAALSAIDPRAEDTGSGRGNVFTTVCVAMSMTWTARS